MTGELQSPKNMVLQVPQALEDKPFVIVCLKLGATEVNFGTYFEESVMLSSQILFVPIQGIKMTFP